MLTDRCTTAVSYHPSVYCINIAYPLLYNRKSCPDPITTDSEDKLSHPEAFVMFNNCR